MHKEAAGSKESSTMSLRHGTAACKLLPVLLADGT